MAQRVISRARDCLAKNNGKLTLGACFDLWRNSDQIGREIKNGNINVFEDLMAVGEDTEKRTYGRKLVGLMVEKNMSVLDGNFNERALTTLLRLSRKGTNRQKEKAVEMMDNHFEEIGNQFEQVKSATNPIWKYYVDRSTTDDQLGIKCREKVLTECISRSGDAYGVLDVINGCLDSQFYSDRRLLVKNLEAVTAVLVGDKK